MRTRPFFIILLGTLACILMMDGLVLQPLWNGDSGSVYAWKGKSDPERVITPYRPDHRSPSCDPPANSSIPEPSTLILLGMGVTGISVYLYKGRKYRK